MISTKLLVLSKLPYRENSLIFHGLSSEWGKLDFLIKGAREVGKRKFPIVDLFREISVEFKNPDQELHSIYKADLIENHDNIAQSSENFREACAIAKFADRNSKPRLECPDFFLAVRTAFKRLSNEKSIFPNTCLVKLAYLKENGLLPEQLGRNGEDPKLEQHNKLLLVNLLEFSLGIGKTPEIELEYWKRIDEWVNALCIYHSLL